MSDVERFYNAIRAKMNPSLPEWHQLDPQRQHLIISGINLILQGIA